MNAIDRIAIDNIQKNIDNIFSYSGLAWIQDDGSATLIPVGIFAFH